MTIRIDYVCDHFNGSRDLNCRQQIVNYLTDVAPGEWRPIDEVWNHFYSRFYNTVAPVGVNVKEMINEISKVAGDSYQFDGGTLGIFIRVPRAVSHLDNEQKYFRYFFCYILSRIDKPFDFLAFHFNETFQRSEDKYNNHRKLCISDHANVLGARVELLKDWKPEKSPIENWKNPGITLAYINAFLAINWNGKLKDLHARTCNEFPQLTTEDSLTEQFQKVRRETSKFHSDHSTEITQAIEYLEKILCDSTAAAAAKAFQAKQTTLGKEKNN